MSCYRTSNNKHFTAPPRMADGRHFTDYSPNCNLNMSIKNDNSIGNSYEYRQFLLNNGNKLMNKYGRLLIRKSGTEPKIRIMGESHNKRLILKCIKLIKKSVK